MPESRRGRKPEPPRSPEKPPKRAAEPDAPAPAGPITPDEQEAVSIHEMDHPPQVDGERD